MILIAIRTAKDGRQCLLQNWWPSKQFVSVREGYPPTLTNVIDSKVGCHDSLRLCRETSAINPR
jgi:hypothetical protein